MRFNFIKNLEALQQKHKYGSELYLKLADLVMDNASIC
jgi:hypothetical protein